MIALICFVLAVLASPFKSKSRLEAENAALRHQLIVLRRKMPGRPWLTNNDRWFFLQMYRWFPSILKVVSIAGALASGRLSLLLALEVIGTGRAGADRGGIARADPADEHREPTLGRAAHPRRITQARPCRRSIKRRQIHGQATWAAKLSNRTARAKGVYERLVISRHALGNALLPAITAPAVKVSGVARTDIASHSARSRACWMVGFAIPMPEGSNPEGKGLDAGPTARLLAPAEAGRHLVERSGSLASDAKQRCPDNNARLVCRRGVGASCRDHGEVRPWRSNALHSAPSRLTESRD